jgi:hypothetical protein
VSLAAQKSANNAMTVHLNRVEPWPAAHNTSSPVCSNSLALKFGQTLSHLGRSSVLQIQRRSCTGMRAIDRAFGVQGEQLVFTNTKTALVAS